MMASRRTHIILAGACYLDTILSVPYYPAADSKLRATKRQVRRGGNCPNTLEVLCQLLAEGLGDSDDEINRIDAAAHLVASLPARDSLATAQIAASFGEGVTAPALRGRPESHPSVLEPRRQILSLDDSFFREGFSAAASSYIIRSEADDSRTIVNYNDLPEMTAEEFAAVVHKFQALGEPTWWHFEGRNVEESIKCVQLIRAMLPEATISVEVEKPGREGLIDLAAEADVVFYSKSWAEDRGHHSAETCLRRETHPRARLAFCTWSADGAGAMDIQSGIYHHSPATRPGDVEVKVVDTVGAGDTFIAGILFAQACRPEWDVQRGLAFAVALSKLKVQREGFAGLASDVGQTWRLEHGG